MLDNAYSIKEASKLLDCSTQNIYRQKAELMSKGLMEQASTGSYYLTEKGINYLREKRIETMKANNQGFNQVDSQDFKSIASPVFTDNTELINILKQNIEEYTERQKLLTDIERVGKKCVFTKASAKTIYRKDDLAKVADTLLFFNNIEASFVIGKIDKNTIGVSARSLGNFDISKVLETLGGGGTDYQGAAQVENETLSKVEQELKKAILQEEGE